MYRKPSLIPSTTTPEGDLSILHNDIYYKRLSLLGDHLLDPCFSIEATNSRGQTPLNFALTLDEEDGETKHAIIKEILRSGANINTPDNRLLHPIHAASISTNIYIFRDIVDQLGISVDAITVTGMTALHFVQDPAMAQILIDKGAEVNAIDRSGNTPLHLAITKNLDLCKVLLDNGAKINKKNCRGETPLIIAMSEEREELTLFLLQNGANVNTSNLEQNPLEIAYKKSFSEEVKNQCWILTENVSAIRVLLQDESLEERLLKKWNDSLQTEGDLKKFFESMRHFLLNYSDDRLIVCVVFLKYFLARSREISSDDSRKLVRFFSTVFEYPVLSFLLKTYTYSQRDNDEETLFGFCEILIMHGASIDLSDIEVVYLEFGDCDLLKYLLRFRIESNMRCVQEIPFFPRILFEFTTNLREVVNGYYVTGINVVDLYNVHNLSRYCTLPLKLIRQFCDIYHNIDKFQVPSVDLRDINVVIEEMKMIDRVPSLLELSRNASRVALGRYGVKQPSEGDKVLDSLGAPRVIKDMILLRCPLHWEIVKPRYFPHTKQVHLLL